MTLIASAIAGILYRLGGWGKPFRSAYRDIGIPLIFLIYMGIKAWHWSLIPSAVLLYASLTTYWKILNPVMGKPTTDAYWFNWLAHGLGIAISILPYIYFTGHWFGFGARLIILPLLITFWSQIWSEVNAEEFGRGFFIVITLPLVL
jgi:hypothetical protein